MGDADLAGVVARAGAGLIAMVSDGPAAPSPDGPAAAGHPSSGVRDPVEVVSARLAESLALARRAGIPPDAIVIDPGIGFFRRRGIAWHEWDVAVLAGLGRLRALARPIYVGVSRKSFLGALTGEGDPARRLPGSLAATAAAVLAGAHVIRTHDVAETLQAVRVAEAVRLGARVGQGPSS
jgi:dihydropteroate synthase